MPLKIIEGLRNVSLQDVFLEIKRYIIPLAFFGVMLYLFRTQMIDEEAYIILRYSRNIANGYGFVWNPGDTPIWGSTSLSWTILLALGTMITGIPLPEVTQTFGVALSVIIIIIICHECPDNLSATVAGSFVAVSTLVGQALVGLDCLLFSLVLMLTYLNRDNGPRLVFFGLVLSVTRPEGLIVAGVFILVHFYENRDIRIPVLFGVIGGAIFLCIFIYFGDILPNPLYVKTLVGQDVSSILERNGRNLLGHTTRFESLIPLVVIAIYMLKTMEEHEIWKTLLGFLPIIVYIILYIGIHQTQNVLGRFQYPVVPILYLVAAVGIGSVFIHPKTRTHALVFVCLFGLLLAAEYDDSASRLHSNIEDTHKVVIGQALSEFSGFTLATTDAGIVPYYSQWKVIDLLGLNDRHIAKEGLSSEYLDGFDIHIFMSHTRWLNWSEMKNDSVFNVLYPIIQYFIEDRNFTIICMIPYSVDVGVMNFYAIAPSFDDRNTIIEALCTADVPYAYNILEP